MVQLASVTLTCIKGSLSDQIRLQVHRLTTWRDSRARSKGYHEFMGFVVPRDYNKLYPKLKTSFTHQYRYIAIRELCRTFSFFPNVSESSLFSGKDTW